MRYPILISGRKGAYVGTFPDWPRCQLAPAVTLDEVWYQAEEAMQREAARLEYLGEPLPDATAPEDVDVPAGYILSSVLLVRVTPQREGVRWNLSLDAGVADVLDAEARRRGLSRKALVEFLARFLARSGG